MNLAEKILQIDDRKSKTVTIDEWGGDFIVKEMDGKMREKFEISSQIGDMKAITESKPNIVVGCLYTIDDVKVFDKKHAPKLASKSGNIINTICMDVLSLSGITQEALDESEKN